MSVQLHGDKTASKQFFCTSDTHGFWLFNEEKSFFFNGLFAFFGGVRPAATQHIHQYGAGFRSREGHPENWPPAHMPAEIPECVCV